MSSSGLPTSTSCTPTAGRTHPSPLQQNSGLASLAFFPPVTHSMPCDAAVPGECLRQAAHWRTLCVGYDGATSAPPSTTLAPPRVMTPVPGPSPCPLAGRSQQAPLGAHPTTSGQLPQALYDSIPFLLNPTNAPGATNPRRIWRQFLWGLAYRITRKDLPIAVPRPSLYNSLRLMVDAATERARDLSDGASLRLLIDLLLDLTNISWLLLLLEEYYPDMHRPAKATRTSASRGLGSRGNMPIPPHIWEAVVPRELVEQYKSFVPVGDLAPRAPSSLTRIMITALKRDGFLLPHPDPSSGSNMTAFVKPKTIEKCAFIADLRGLNQLSTNKAPPFHLPSAGDVAHIMAQHPPGSLWACSIDITNFFWSLRLPAFAVGAFRIGDLTYDCAPFGWNLSPVIAQATLGHLIMLALQPFADLWMSQAWTFHYYDDVLLIATSQDLATHLTLAVTTTFSNAGLLISPKSCLQAVQNITWLGKTFDLTHRTVHSTRSCLLHTLARCLLASVHPPHPRLIRRLMGHILWSARPRKGATLLTRGWFCHLHQGPRYLALPTLGMQRGLFDCFALSLVPWKAVDPLPAPFLTPTICMDAAKVGSHYQVGLWSPVFGARIICAPPEVLSQQQAELFAADAATRLATRLGWTQLTLVGDNKAALYLLHSLRPNLQVPTMVHILRRILNRLLWSGLRAHLIWVPTDLQPADGPSRATIGDSHSVRDALREADTRWHALLTNPTALAYHGVLAP